MLSVWLRDVDGQALHSLSGYETILGPRLATLIPHVRSSIRPRSVLDSSIYKPSSLICPTPVCTNRTIPLEGVARSESFVDCAMYMDLSSRTYLLCVNSRSSTPYKVYNFCETCSCSTCSQVHLLFNKC